MRSLIIIIGLFFMANKCEAQNQIPDNGPKAFFGSLEIDSISASDIFKYDTLKMTNSNLKIQRFTAILSDTIDDPHVLDGYSYHFIEGDRISNSKSLVSIFNKQKSKALLLTIVDIEFINMSGKLIKYSKQFRFRIYCDS